MSAIKNGAVVSFKNAETDTCIDLTGSNAENNTPVIGYHYTGTSNQQWMLEEVGMSDGWPVYMIRNRQTGTYMDLYNGGRENGTEIVGWAGGDANNDHQRWRFITGDADHKDMVKIQNVGTGTFVDLYNGDSQDCTKITGWAGEPYDYNNLHQQWKVECIY